MNLYIENNTIKTSAPSWCMHKLGGGIFNSPNNTMTYNTLTNPTVNCKVNMGNGTMTCTIPGRYFVFFNGFGEVPMIGQGYTFNISFRKNNNDISTRMFSTIVATNNFQPTINMQGLIDLDVGDTVSVFMYSGSFHTNANCFFGGYMIS
jgi:hypothetical protein